MSVRASGAREHLRRRVAQPRQGIQMLINDAEDWCRFGHCLKLDMGIQLLLVPVED